MLIKFVTLDGKKIEFEVNDMKEALQKSIEYTNKHHLTTEEHLMLNQAVDFHRLANELFPKSLDREGLKGKLSIFTVNASFGLEIYLKLAVKISTNKKKHGHKLQIIFNALSNDAKKEIEDMVRLKAQKLYPNATELITAEFIVSKLNEAFVNWRYSYEYDNNGKTKTLDCPMNEACLLLDVLNIYCTKHIKPSHSKT